jgi:hypothetical protein
MAHDESLASRVLDLLEGQPDLTQKKMFVGSAALDAADGLGAWVDKGLRHALSLPPK